MKIGQAIQSLTINGMRFDMRRTPEGVIEVSGEDDLSLAAATGFAHAMDRMLQMAIVRLIGQGRVGECLSNDADSLAIDKLFREVGFYRDAKVDAGNFTGDILCFAQNYCRGVNEYLLNDSYPWEFKVVRYKPELWTVADVLLTIKLMSFVPFAQAQQQAEKFIIQAVKAGTDPDRLKRLFSPHLDGMTPEIIEVIKQTQVFDPVVPSQKSFLSGLPNFQASNNWVISGSRTASGKPIQCNDPHLECNRLPAFWYELVQHTADNFRIGVTVPGIPGLIMGRTREVSFGFTYGCMDMVDYYIEDVQGGKCRRGRVFEDFTIREEVIRRKGKPSEKIMVWENRHGVLETPPEANRLKDGYYLARAWSGRHSDGSQSLSALYQLVQARTVAELQHILSGVSVSCNWLVADTLGNIGYQQSGRLPIRQHSGLHPVPGWDEYYDWRGYATGDQLARITNPSEGYLATANNDMNQKGKPLSINLPIGPYRFERICQLIERVDAASIDSMKVIQRDRYSRQAERFMLMLGPLLPDSSTGRLLKEWDFQYLEKSRAACLFEDIYSELMEEVFGKRLFGAEAWRHLVTETTIVVHFYHIFDDILLGNESSWFGATGREELLRVVAKRVLNRFPNPDSVPTLGSRQRFMMTQVLFGGKLPRLAGFDRGPVVLEGNRATIVQGVIYRSGGRTGALAQSLRFITDLAGTKAHTVIAGGPSDRRFSKYYACDIRRWLNYEYKVLDGGNRRGDILDKQPRSGTSFPDLAARMMVHYRL